MVGSITNSRVRSYAPISNPTRFAARRTKRPSTGCRSTRRALVDLRRLQPHISSGALENQVSTAQFQLGCRIKLQLGLRRVGARRNLEIVFQLALASVEHQIDARINAVVANSGKLRNPRMPLPWIVADEVVAPAGKRIISGDHRRRVGTGQRHPYRPHAPTRLTLSG